MNPCPRCGTSFQPDDLFCGYCGRSIQIKESDHSETEEAFNLSDIQFRLGIVHLKKREYYKAVEKFEKTLENDPENRKAQELLVYSKRVLQQTRDDT